MPCAAAENDVYDPEDVGLQDSPLLKPLNPRLQPTPSPSLGDSEGEDVKPIPSRGDAVLIGLLGGGRAPEVARTAGTDLLAVDDEEDATDPPPVNGDKDGSTAGINLGDATNLKALATKALSAANFHTTTAATAPDDPPPGDPKIAAPQRNIDNCMVQSERGNFHRAPQLFSTLVNNELAPILQHQSKVNGLALPSITAQFRLLVDSSLAMKADKDDSFTPPLSASPSTSQMGTPPLDALTLQQIPQKDDPKFSCLHPGCKALPFRSAYLLNSHTNVHSSDRPHFCPKRGCPRGEGGKGFKRKNEMIRHGLVHESPGYVCPYCADREHKYPRPDNLQRHVRVHHVDRDKDDSLLSEILAQRPEGSVKRRRRGHGSILPPAGRVESKAS